MKKLILQNGLQKKYASRGALFKIKHCGFVIIFFIAVAFTFIVSGCMSPNAPAGRTAVKAQNWSAVYQHISFGRYDQAITLSNQLITDYPNDPTGYYYRGMAFHFKGNYDQALKDVDHSISLKPDDFNYYCQRAFIYFKNKEFEKSLTDFTKAINLGQKNTIANYDASGKPVFNSVYADRAATYAMLEQYNEAIEDMERAIAAQPENPNYYLFRANQYISTAQLDKAFSDAKKSADLNPSFPNTFNMMGIVMFYKGNFQQAMTYYDKAIDLANRNQETTPALTSVFHGNRALSRWQSKMTSKAVEDALKSVNSLENEFGSFAMAHYYFHLGYFMHETGKTGTARAYFKRSLDQDPEILTKRKKFLAPRYALHPLNLEFFKKESETALRYLDMAAVKTQNIMKETDLEKNFSLDMTMLKVSPKRIAVNTSFDIYLNYHLEDSEIQLNQDRITFVFEIIQNQKTLYRSSPIMIQPVTPGPGTWVQHMNPSSLKGAFSVRASLEYKNLSVQKTTGFIIE